MENCEVPTCPEDGKFDGLCTEHHIKKREIEKMNKHEKKCSDCGIKASEAKVFFNKLGKCKKCYERGYRENKRTEIKAEGKKNVPENKAIPSSTSNEDPECVVCGIKASEANKFNIKRGICYKCKDAEYRKNKKLKGKKKPAKPTPSPEKKKIEEQHLASFVIDVDFSEFPKLHEKLLNMAHEELRDPGMQLLYLLRNDLASIEDKL